MTHENIALRGLYAVFNFLESQGKVMYNITEKDCYGEKSKLICIVCGLPLIRLIMN
jgi:hypothetical protein